MTRLSHWIAAASVAALAFSDFAAAHLDGHAMTEEQYIARKLYVENGRRLLESCSNSEAGRLLQTKAIARRLAMLDSYTRRRLSLSTALATDHKSTLTGLSSTTDPSDLFGSTPTCVLEPKVTEGPYYVTGELVRSDIRESQPGIDLYMDLQFIDINTCKPVNDLYVDFWHANASGVYSGVVASTNGNSKDATNVNATFHRGLSPTDSDGFVSFTTKFPGFYTGRSTHIHIMTHYNGSASSLRYSGGHVSHVGQLFFDQTLLTEVQATGVYANNKAQVTLNSADNIVKESAASNFDPFAKYVLLGDSVNDGLLSWISVGVDMTQDFSVSVAGTYTGSGSPGTANTTYSSASDSASNSASESASGSTLAAAVGNDGVKLGQCFAQVLAIALALMHFLL